MFFTEKWLFMLSDRTNLVEVTSTITILCLWTMRYLLLSYIRCKEDVVIIFINSDPNISSLTVFVPIYQALSSHLVLLSYIVCFETTFIWFVFSFCSVFASSWQVALLSYISCGDVRVTIFSYQLVFTRFCAEHCYLHSLGSLHYIHQFDMVSQYSSTRKDCSAFFWQNRTASLVIIRLL